MVCRAPDIGDRSIHWGECEPDELCVDGWPDARFQQQGLTNLMAYCVNRVGFVQVALGMSAGQTVSSKQDTGFHAASGASHSVEAILTGLDGRLLVNAESLKIQAQASDSTGSVQSWGTLVDGVDHCNNCSTVQILTVPTGTQRITTQVELMPETERALLFLASVFNGG